MQPPALRRQVSTGPWSCLACTFDNSGGSRCEMCGSSRPVLERQRSALKPSNAECPICLERVPDGDAALQLSCRHAMCRGCFKDYAENEIKSHKFPLRCPFSKCETKPAYSDLSSSDVEGKALVEFEHWTLRAEIESRPDWRPCLTPDCPSGGFWKQDSAASPNFACPVCNKSWCMKCRGAGHSGKCNTVRVAISQDDSKASNESLDIMIKNGQIRLCPHCGTPTLWNGGCPQLTCRVCKGYWHWESAFNAYQQEPGKPMPWGVWDYCRAGLILATMLAILYYCILPLRVTTGYGAAALVQLSYELRTRARLISGFSCVPLGCILVHEFLLHPLLSWFFNLFLWEWLAWAIVGLATLPCAAFSMFLAAGVIKDYHK